MKNAENSIDTYGDEWKSTKLDDGQKWFSDAKKAKEELQSEDCLEAEGVKF